MRWPTIRLRAVVHRIEQGWSPQCESRPAEPDEWGVLKVGCVNGGVFNADENKALPPDLAPLPELEVRDGDLLMSRANTLELVGGVALIRNTRRKLLLCDKVYRIAVNRERATPEFLAYALRAHQSRGFIEGAATGASPSMKNISQEAVRELSLRLPSVVEQQAVAGFLDVETGKIDGLIERQSELIQLVEEKRSATTTNAITVGIRRGAPMRHSGVGLVGSVPEHWKTVRLRHVAMVQSGIALGRKSEAETLEVPYLRVANVQDGYLDLSEIKTISVTADEAHRYALRPGDVLMNEGGDNDKLGRGAIWHGEISPCIHQNHVFAVRPHGVEPEWLTMITGSDYAKRFFETRAKQTTNLASISSSNLREVPVVLPPPDERAEILEYLRRQHSAMDALVAKSAEMIERLREHRAALITAAVTGQIDVQSVQAAKVMAA